MQSDVLSIFRRVFGDTSECGFYLVCRPVRMIQKIFSTFSHFTSQSVLCSAFFNSSYFAPSETIPVELLVDDSLVEFAHAGRDESDRIRSV